MRFLGPRPASCAAISHPSFPLIFHVPRSVCCHFAAKIQLHNMQCQIDTGAEAARSKNDGITLHVSHVPHQCHGGKCVLEVHISSMMRRCALSIEQTRFRQHKNPCAHGHHDIAMLCCCPQPVHHFLGVTHLRRHNHDVGLRGVIEGVVRDHS